MALSQADQVKEFKNMCLADSKARAEESGEGTRAAYAAEICSYLTEAEQMADYVPSYFEGQSSRFKYHVDGYAYNEPEQILTLVFVDFKEGEERSFTRTQGERGFEQLRRFLSAAAETDLIDDLEISLPIYDLVQRIHDLPQSIKKYQFFVITDGTKGKNTTKFEPEYFQEKPVLKAIWDPGRIYASCCFEDSSENLDIDFRSYVQDGLPCLAVDVRSSPKYKSFLGVIPGDVLADLYEQYGSKILESNVRSFLTTKVSVNKKIRNTILNEPEMFFAYNNGIALTASKVKTVKQGKATRITQVSNPQIINGGQTTASLAAAKFGKDHADLSKINVQIKLTEINPSAGAEERDQLIQSISRSSNSQNKVTDADFFSSHPFHKQMENWSKKASAPEARGAQYKTLWFYERTRGQYLQELMHQPPSKKVQWEKRRPKEQVIKKTELAKVMNAWAGKPYVVSQGEQTNFSDFAKTIDKAWAKNPEVFNKKYYQDTVSLVIMFKFLEKGVTKEVWYKGAYRANIICYTMAWLHELIKEQYPKKDLNLNLIWKEQDIPENLKKILLELAETVLAVITSKDRKVENVTQWCKREACWNSLKQVSLKLPKEIEPYLVSARETREKQQKADKEQKTFDGIKAQDWAVSQKPDFWKTVSEFAVKNELIKTKAEQNDLNKIMKTPAVVPADYECLRLAKLVERCEKEGFKYKA